MENLSRYQKGQKLSPNQVLKKEDFDAWKLERDLKKDYTSLNQENLKELEKKKKQAQSSEEGINILGPELYELIFGRLNFKIKLSNIKIYLENDTRVPRNLNTLDKSFSIALMLKNFNFSSEEIQQHLQQDGRFKDFVNVEKAINTLPNSNSTKILYFILKIGKLGVQFYSGTQHLINVGSQVLSAENKNVLKKLEYFDLLEEVSYTLV